MNRTVKPKEITVGNYKILNFVGRGSYGSVYLAYNIKSNEKVCLKLEQKDNPIPQLQYEFRILQLLKGHTGFPQPIWFGDCGEYYSVAMTALGPNLMQLLDFCDHKFGLKTTLVLGLQMI